MMGPKYHDGAEGRCQSGRYGEALGGEGRDILGSGPTELNRGQWGQ